MGQRNSTVFALVAALFGALAVAAPVAIRGTPPTPTPALTSIGATSESQELPESGKRPFRILSDFLGLNDNDAFKDWDSGADLRAAYKIEFLIATLPEPLGGGFRYKFDTYLDAIQRAAEASGFILDRFDLPWGDPSKSASTLFKLGEEIDLTLGSVAEGKPPIVGSLSPNRHASTSAQDLPGLLLFRSRETPEHRLLLVFLIGETPTWEFVRKH